MYCLSSTDFSSVRSDKGVERHILGFERCYRKAIVLENAAERRYQHALTDIGGGALYHDNPSLFSLHGSLRQVSPKRWQFSTKYGAIEGKLPRCR